MILKELDPFASGDLLARSGRAAEEQMAFYLRRAFAADPDTLVLNGIRLARDGDAAQMDHLVAYPFGLIIIESKSVTGTVRINAQGEWVRVYGRKVSGMPSPILQAERQADFLRQYVAGREGWPTSTPKIAVMAAISDGGVVQRPRGLDLPDVWKADQITHTIRKLLDAKRTLQSGSGLIAQALRLAFGGEVAKELDRQEAVKIADFLLRHHSPRPAPGNQGSQVPQPPRRSQPLTVSGSVPESAGTCRSCSSRAVRVEYGYSYYYRCLDCKRPAPINQFCAQCRNKQTVRKDGQDFFAECERCGTSTLFHSNHARVDAGTG